jgi:hypothetical protein
MKLKKVHSLEAIPEFASEEEEARFWAEHGLGEELLEAMSPPPGGVPSCPPPPPREPGSSPLLLDGRGTLLRAAQGPMGGPEERAQGLTQGPLLQGSFVLEEGPLSNEEEKAGRGINLGGKGASPQPVRPPFGGPVGDEPPKRETYHLLSPALPLQGKALFELKSFPMGRLGTWNGPWTFLEGGATPCP